VAGIAKFNPNLFYKDHDPLAHISVIVFGMPMAYDTMVEIGPKSQEEVHRVYFTLDEMGMRLSHRIGALGFQARTHTNTGDFPLPAYGYLAGLGEMGKHGCLLSPELGSSFRLSAVSTDLPLIVDGPQDLGYDEICTNCDICTRFCPGEAISSQKREVAGVLRWHVDSDLCQPHFSKMYGCKICLSVCPMSARVPALRENYKVMAKTVREAKNAEGMLKTVIERSDMHFDEFEGMAYDPDEFGNKPKK
jgi:epoxyqueuosine reductase QueG